MTNETIRIARQLLEIAADQKAHAKAVDGARRELHLADAKTCEAAATLLQKLDTEVYRLRQGIGCHHYGRLGERELWQMAQGWNDDTALSAGK